MRTPSLHCEGAWMVFEPQRLSCNQSVDNSLNDVSAVLAVRVNITWQHSYCVSVRTPLTIYIDPLRSVIPCTDDTSYTIEFA